MGVATGLAWSCAVALLRLTGYEGNSINQIKSFRDFGSHRTGHPERDIRLGIELTTGQLGQGIANALGMAIAEEHLNTSLLHLIGGAGQRPSPALA